jgi:exosome complex protein LRP1
MTGPAYLRLHGVDAKQHPVFRELTRVRQYFAKIKDLETEPEQRSMTLDKEAAGRFIKHGLVSTNLVQMPMIVANTLQSGNDKYDLERAEKQAKERAQAEFKAAQLARKNAAAASQSNDQIDKDESEEKTDEAAAKYQKKIHKKKKEDKLISKGKIERKGSKADRSEEKKERRQKKEEFRKARKAQ